MIFPTGQHAIPLVRITGNGPGTVSTDIEPSLDVLFNPPPFRKPNGNELLIRNRRIAKAECGPPLRVESTRLSSSSIAAVEQMLLASHEELSPQLGCLPSSGLATVNCFMELSQTLQVDCMPLLPSLIRPAAMDRRQPLPCVFHNWLGERRLAKEMRLWFSPNRISWPGLSSTIVNSRGSRQADPMNRLLRVFDENCAHPAARSELLDLAAASNESWLASLDLKALAQVEPNFFLPRTAQHSAQWWLYDNDISRGIDEILKRLMWCQQTLTK